MSMTTTQTVTRVALVGAALFTIACGGKEEPAPARQIDLAPAGAAQPQLADAPAPAATTTPAANKATAPRKAEPAPQKQPETAPAPAPVAAAPAPVSPPAPTTGTIATGTMFAVKPSSRICTSTHKPGDRFTAALTSPMQGTNGAEVPAGAVAVLRVIEDSASRDSTRLAYDLISVRVGEQVYEVSARVTQSAQLERINTQTNRDKATKIAAGAAIGAIAGRVLGGNTKSTVIGGAIGAAAGGAVAASGRKMDGCLKDDGTITLALDKPLTIKLATAP